MSKDTKGHFAGALGFILSGIVAFGKAKLEAIKTGDIKSAYEAERREEELSLTYQRAANASGEKLPDAVQTVVDRIAARQAVRKGEPVTV